MWCGVAVQECIDEEETDLTEDSSGSGSGVHGRQRGYEADSGISRTTDDSLQNDDLDDDDDSCELDTDDTDSAAATSPSSAQYARPTH